MNQQQTLPFPTTLKHSNCPSNWSHLNLWSTIETENFTIYYAKDFAGDAQRAKTYLNSTIESMVKEFSEYEPEEILKKVGLLTGAEGTPPQSMREMVEETAPGVDKLTVVDFLEQKKKKEDLNLWRFYNLITQHLTHGVGSDIKRERMMGKLSRVMQPYEALKAA